jgi:hypothetical protein
LQSDPWAEVTIDGKPTGKTTPLRGHRLTAGTHRVELVNPGFAPVKLSIKIPANGTLTKQVPLSP